MSNWWRIVPDLGEYLYARTARLPIKDRYTVDVVRSKARPFGELRGESTIWVTVGVQYSGIWRTHIDLEFMNVYEISMRQHGEHGQFFHFEVTVVIVVARE